MDRIPHACVNRGGVKGQACVFARRDENAFAGAECITEFHEAVLSNPSKIHDAQRCAQNTLKNLSIHPRTRVIINDSHFNGHKAMRSHYRIDHITEIVFHIRKLRLGAIEQTHVKRGWWFQYLDYFQNSIDDLCRRTLPLATRLANEYHGLKTAF